MKKSNYFRSRKEFRQLLSRIIFWTASVKVTYNVPVLGAVRDKNTPIFD